MLRVVLFQTTTTKGASTLGQTQTGLEPRVYFFTTTGCCTGLPKSDTGNGGVEPASGFAIQNFRDLMLHVMPDV